MHQLTRRLTQVLPEAVRVRGVVLSLKELENLDEALLDFVAIADLSSWFAALDNGGS